MASQRQLFVRRMYLVATLLVVSMGLLFAGIVWLGYGRTDSGPGFLSALALAMAVYVAAGMLVATFLVSWTVRNILRPLGNTVVVASRVAEGDLSVAVSAISSHETDGLTTAVATMLAQLRTLVSAIRGSAQEAASMAQQISSSTQQMSASTQEVSGTCNDLTDRATRQAALVRSAFEESNDAAERVNKVCSLVGSALLSPGLPLMLGSVAEQALSKQAGDLTPDGRESIELLENAEQTWNQGAKAYAKVWQTWSLDDATPGSGTDEPVETMNGR